LHIHIKYADNFGLQISIVLIVTQMYYGQY
jgi:hypothetical protein